LIDDFPEIPVRRWGFPPVSETPPMVHLPFLMIMLCYLAAFIPDSNSTGGDRAIILGINYHQWSWW